MAGGFSPPAATLSRAYNVNDTTVTFDGGVYGYQFPVTGRGLVYNTTGNIGDPLTKITVAGKEGEFTKTVTGLTKDVQYYFWSFANYVNYNTGAAGVSYSNRRSFIAGDPDSALTVPELYFLELSDVQESSANAYAEIYDDGGSPITERGFVWSKNPNPTISNNRIAVAGSSESFSAELTGLSASTTYYVRSYAVNSKGRAYSDDFTLQTKAPPAPIIGEWKMTIDTSKGDGLPNFKIYYVGAEDFNIDWGDGQKNEHISGSSDITHTYATGGIYEITMTGRFTESEFPLSDGSHIHFGGSL